MTTRNYEHYVSAEVAKLLEKAGFDWQDYFVAHSIDEHFHWEIPLHIAQKWLREIKNEVILVDAKAIDFYQVHILGRNGSTKLFRTYETALENGIKLVTKRLIKIQGR